MLGRGDFSRREGWSERNTEGSGNDLRREIGRAHDHIQRSHWLRPSDRDAHERATTINTPLLEQTSFSNAIKRTRRSDRIYEIIYNN